MGIACAGVLAAEMVDRVVIAIGHHAITESQLEEELRVTAMLNHAPLRIDADGRRKAAERLIAQHLLAREMELSHFPRPEPANLSEYERKVEDEFDGPAAMARALASYGLTRAVLEEHLAVQLRTLAFTRFRFPTDEALNSWLGEARRRSDIQYLDKTLQ